MTAMLKRKVRKRLTLALTLTALLAAGCVERRLTIVTEPKDALVTLNDEEIGVSPVTVPFQWYGDYNVRISKDGYQTLDTHQKLKRPWYDYFPFDFFAQIVNPDRIVDEYEWTFQLTPKRYPSRTEIIEQSEELKEDLDWQLPERPE